MAADIYFIALEYFYDLELLPLFNLDEFENDDFHSVVILKKQAMKAKVMKLILLSSSDK